MTSEGLLTPGSNITRSHEEIQKRALQILHRRALSPLDHKQLLKVIYTFCKPYR